MQHCSCLGCPLAFSRFRSFHLKTSAITHNLTNFLWAVTSSMNDHYFRHNPSQQFFCWDKMKCYTEVNPSYTIYSRCIPGIFWTKKLFKDLLYYHHLYTNFWLGIQTSAKLGSLIKKVVGLLMTSLLILLSKRLEKDFRVNEKGNIG